MNKYLLQAAAQQSSVLNYNPASDADVNLWLSSRSGLTLVDSIAVNNAAIKLPMVDSSRVDSTHNIKLVTGVVPNVGSIWVIKGNATLINATHAMGQGDAANAFYIAVASSKWFIAWGNKTASSTGNADTDPHVFIFYNGKFWVRPVTTELTDDSILNVINTITPDISTASPAWGTGVLPIWFGAVNLGYAHGGGCFALAESYLGTITTGVITWHRKYIFNNIYYAYDLIDATKSVAWVNYLGTAPSRPTLKYNEYGSQYCLDNGHTLLQKDIKTFISVPYLLAGTPNTIVANPTGFATVKDFEGSATKLNYTDCIIRFVGAQFDRSNATLFSAEARAAISRYDSGNVNDWHVTELNRNWLDNWLNTAYKGTIFIKTDSNSMQLETASNILEIITVATNKTGADFDKVLKYCGDYNLYYYPLWDKRNFTNADLVKSLLYVKITGQTEEVSQFGNFIGNWKWGRGTLAPNGKIYHPPMHLDTLLILDTSNDSVTTPVLSIPNPTDWKWGTSILSLQGNIYGIPFNNDDIIKINPINDTYTYFSSGRTIDEKFVSAVLVGNTIYCIPYSEAVILKINTVDDSLTTIGSFTSSNVNGAPGFAKFGHAKLAPNGCIYAPPVLWDKILKIDTSNDSITEIGTFGGGFKWMATAMTADGKMYCLPYNIADASIMVIDTNTDTVSYIATGLTGGSGAELFGGAVLAPNGLIYGIPFSADIILVIDPSDNSLHTFGDLSAVNEQYYGGVIAPNGSIYAAPYHYSTAFLKILSEQPIDKNLALSRLVGAH